MHKSIDKSCKSNGNKHKQIIQYIISAIKHADAHCSN